MTRSTFGLMIERAVTVSHTSAKCRRCHGKGFVELTPEQLARWSVRIAKTHEDERHHERAALSRACTCGSCCGSGYTPQKVEADREKGATHVACDRCRGTGEVVWDPVVPGVERGDPCPHCFGVGWTVPITARPTGSSKHGIVPRRDHDDPGDAAEAPAAAPTEGELVALMDWKSHQAWKGGGA
jgi:DnaJ-class molecular chaperone